MDISKKCAIEADNFSAVFLHKQGNFFKAYNKSAMRFQREFFEYRIMAKFIKKENDNVYYLGFPVSSWDKVAAICSEKNYEVEQSDEFCKICVGTNPDENYELWCKDIPIRNDSPKDARSETKNETNERDAIFQMIEKFPLASKTPFEALEFLNNIQGKIRLMGS